MLLSAVLLFTALNFLRMGTTGLAAQAHGAQDADGGRAVLRQGLVVALVLAALLVVASGPVEALALALIDPGPAVAAEASAYISIRIWAAPATLSLFVLTGWFIGRGDARSPLAIVLTVNLVNVALDFALVWGADMRAGGVAAATVAAEYLGTALGLALARRHLVKSPPASRDARRPENKLLIEVHPDANKHEIKKAMEELCKVKVEKVATVHVSGKMKGPREVCGKTFR